MALTIFDIDNVLIDSLSPHSVTIEKKNTRNMRTVHPRASNRDKTSLGPPSSPLPPQKKEKEIFLAPARRIPKNAIHRAVDRRVSCES